MSMFFFFLLDVELWSWQRTQWNGIWMWHNFNEQSGCLFVVVQTHNPTFVVHWFLINCGSNVNIQWILSVTISKWIMLQCWFYFIFKILLLISAKHHPIMNYWYSHALIYFCGKLLVFCLKKKKKSEKKFGKKHVVFSFQYQFCFQQNIHHFCKTHKRKKKQNATMVIHISKFSHYYNFHGLNHC
jgi:hypothetical protein